MNDTLKFEVEVKPEFHHPYGPSRWPALMECPCWEGRDATTDTERGTELHKVFETVLKGGEVEPADELQAHVVKAAERILEMAGENPIESEKIVHQPVPPGHVEICIGDVFGRADAMWMDGGTFHVADLKMAHNPERDYTPQLLAYAIGGMYSDADVVELHIVYADTGGMTTAHIPIEDAKKLYKECYRTIDGIAYKTKNPNGQPPEPKQCGWCSICKHFAACPACVAVAEKTQETLADVTKPERWNALQTTQKAQMCVLAETVIKWGEAVKARAGEDCKAGIPIEDPEHGIYYGLQERRGTLRLDTDAVWGLCKEKGVPRGDFIAALKVDATKAVALLKANGMKAGAAKEALEECGERGPSSVSFVRKAV